MEGIQLVFDHDWWANSAYQERLTEAKHRCARNHFSDLDPAKADKDKNYRKFFDALETRTIIYLRDGFSYEIKDIVKSTTTATFTFECVPADDAYKVGSFVVTLPYEDIVRVEVFAVHPEEKPEDMPAIKGFSSPAGPPPTGPKRGEGRKEAPEA